MKTLTIPLKQQLTLIFLSILIVSFNPAAAQSDKEMMGEVQKAREMKRQNADHAEHLKPVDKSLEFRGVYYGYLPCDNCAGIKTTLSLKNKKNYLLVTQNAQASSREYYEKGKYIWDDKTGTVTLVARRDESIRKFSIKSDSILILLTSDGAPMKGDQSKYTLTRSDKMKSREIHMH